MNDTVVWYKSKTLILNLLAFAVTMAEYALGRPFTQSNPNLSEAFALIVFAGNFWLRLGTNREIVPTK